MKSNALDVKSDSAIIPLRVLVIDNFDSFTYNLVEEIYHISNDIKVVRNDISESELSRLIVDTDLLVLSPGPGRPEDAGICMTLIQKYRGRIPIIGICLGFQAIISVYGGKITEAECPVHGKVSRLTHQNKYFFKDLPNPISIGRYHSLIASEIPPALDCIATSDEVSMCVIDADRVVLGFQFHPESILTLQGSLLFKKAVSCLIDMSRVIPPENSSIQNVS